MKRFFLFFAAIVSLAVATQGCKQPETLKVMSFNIRNAGANDGDNAWPMRRDAVSAMLAAEQPAVFGIQEAYPEQEAFILENCPVYKGFGVGRNDGKDDGERMSVFYRTDLLELVDGGTWWLSETPDVPSKGWDAKYPRTATWARLKKLDSGREFFFVNTHLDHKGVEARKNGLALIYSKIQDMNPDGWPMVLTGDFNILPDNEGLTDLNVMMESARFAAEEADTIGSFNGFKQNGYSDADASMDKEAVLNTLWPIDYIYYSGFDKCLCFRVVTKTYEGKPYISDHYPIFADLIF